MESTAVAKKLLYPKAEKKLVIGAPLAYLKAMENESIDTNLDQAMTGKYDLLQVFGTSKAELLAYCQAHIQVLKPDGLFWACYPKGTGSIKSDLKREVVWEILANIGLQAVSQIAIDETWSALRARQPHLVGT